MFEHVYPIIQLYKYKDEFEYQLIFPPEYFIPGWVRLRQIFSNGRLLYFIRRGGVEGPERIY